ncbi:MAG TPA: hypothetical protein VKQ08_02445, partial [Cyclobacteriaceae bacterium]|nr:hypothetical protein [Cyclobacteriaceae bacterium]
VADGLALKYLGRDNGDFSFLIRAPEKSTWLNQDLKFIVKAGQKILFPVLLSELRQRGAQRILVPSSKMPRGLVELLVTADGSSVSGRWLLDAREDASGEVSVESRYLNRQKVLVKLNVRDVYGQPTAGIFSVRVANALISKDFACNDGRSEPLENATSGVRGQKTSYSDQMTFDQKLMLRGRLYFKDNSNPVPDSTHLALFFQKNLVGYDLYTGHNGNFSFRVPFDFYGHDKASAIAEYQGKELENIRLEIDTELFNPSPALSFSEGSNLDWYGDYQVKRQKTDKAFQYVSATDSMPFTPHNPNDAIEKKIGQADIAVKLSDYLILPSMADIIREIIPSLALRTTDGRTDLKLYLLYSPDKGFSPDANPVIFIDGVMTKDVNYFINMNPSDIVSIKLIRKISKLQKLGFFGKNGAILITTKNASLAGELSRDYPEVIGFTGGLPFINKSHDGKSRARYPDFRSCLYWNPALGTDSQGNATFEFFTSDDIGDFAIQIQGDTGDGRVLSIEKKISVGKKQVR